jgi:hypothetical protein
MQLKFMQTQVPMRQDQSPLKVSRYPVRGVKAYIIVKGNDVYYVKESSYEREFEKLLRDCKKVYEGE